MLDYLGSGRYWQRHIKKHGKEHVITIWYCLFIDRDELVNCALICSKLWNIVKAKDEHGKKIWANEQFENGLDGSTVGRPGNCKEKNGMYGKVG